MKMPGNTEYEAWDAARRAAYPHGIHARYETWADATTAGAVAWWNTGTGTCFLRVPETV